MYVIFLWQLGIILFNAVVTVSGVLNHTQNVQMIAQMKDNETVYWFNWVAYPVLDSVLSFPAVEVQEPYFGINLYGYLYDRNSNNKIYLQLS